MQKRTNPIHIILTISFSQFVMPFMFSGVGITLPSLGVDLQASAIQLGLIESIYLGAAAAVLLPFGRLADLTDKKTIFKIGLVIYTLISFLLGTTSQIEYFIILRLFQGIAGGMLLATNMAILAEQIPRKNLGKAIGLAVGAVYLGLSTGPFIAGIITTHFGWKYVYFFGALLSAIPMIISFITITSDKKFQFAKIDLIGTLLIVSSISLLVGGSASINDGLLGYLFLGLGLTLLIIFVFQQKDAKNKLVDLKLITSNLQLKVALIVQLLNYAGTFGITFLFSLYLQTIKQMTPQQAGTVLMISPIIMTFLAPIFGKLSDKIPPAKIAFTGMCFCFIATLIGLTINASTSLWVIYLLFSSMGIGFAMFSSPNMNIIMSSVEKKYLSMASAITAELRSLGMVISLTLISIFISIYLGENQLSSAHSLAYLKAMHLSIISFVILMGSGVVISVFSLKNKKS